MESNLQKAKRLLRILDDKKALGVFTHTHDGKTMHQGNVITEREKEQLSRQFEKTITITIKTIKS